VSGWLAAPAVWAGLGFALLVVEALAPGYLFLGFAAGAFLSAALLWLAPGAAASMGPLGLLAAFAALSLGFWAAARALLGRRARRAGERRDINDFVSKG
jgi:membrane protein implicated in regulation of membrane protease activity